MPLILNAVPVREETGVKSRRFYHSKAASDVRIENQQDRSQEYPDDEGSNVEVDTIMLQLRPQQADITMPVPPPKSERRASALLPKFAMAVGGLAQGTEVHVRTTSVSGDPMDAYLSSEDSESMSEYEESILETDEHDSLRYLTQFPLRLFMET